MSGVGISRRPKPASKNVNTIPEVDDEALPDKKDHDVQPLEFVTLTGSSTGRSHSRDVLKIVRTQAMRDYVWKQNRPANTQTEKRRAVPEVTPHPPSLYSGRFRLNATSNKSKSKTSNVRKKKQAAKGSTAESPTNRHVQLVTRNTEEELLSHLLDRASSNTQLTSVNGRMDPFDSLSIKIKRESERLLVHYSRTFTMNSVAVNADGDFFSHARTDTALFHAIFYMIALDYEFRLGLGTTRERLYHGGEAFRNIQERLHNGNYSDMTIAAVALLVTKENLDGKYELSSIHMKGLEYMVKERGGIHNIKGVFGRIVTWTDFCHSNVWNCQPRFPRLPNMMQRKTEKQIFRARFELSPKEVFGNSHITSIFESLRQISLALNPEHAAKLDRRAASKQIYNVEYELLMMNNGAYADLEPNKTLKPEVISLKIAAHIYLYLVIRELPSRCHVIYSLVVRLQDTLERLNKKWGNESDAERIWLLWILFVGYAAAVKREDQLWFVEYMEPLCRRLGVWASNELAQVLSGVLWRESWCGSHCQGLAKDLLCWWEA